MIFTLDFLTKLLLLLAVVHGLFVSVFSWLQKTETSTAKFLFSSLITAVSLTLLNDLLHYHGFFKRHQQWLFFPIFYTMWFGPLLFFYVKAALYPKFRLHFKDIKHFIMPWAQVIFMSIMFFSPTEKKDFFWRNDYSVFYGTFAYPIYLFSFTIYTYFAYRFIRHKIKSFNPKEHEVKENKRINRLRQVVKGWYILLIINSLFIVFNFLTEHFLHVSLYQKGWYYFFSSMSFAAMVVWLAAYGYYKIFKWIKS